MQAIRFISNARRWVTSVALVAVLLTLCMLASVPHVQAAQMLPVETLLNADGTLNTRTGASGALDLRGWNVTLDSARGPVLTRDAPTPAAPNADTWSALPHNGLNGIVYALAVMGNDLYVGGQFTQTADGTVTHLNNIAKYSGGAWSPLANQGLADVVNALAVMGNDLYVGGQFTQTTDGTGTHLNNIARYSGGAWYPLTDNGLSGSVRALAVMGNDLYVGGAFTQTNDGTVMNLNRIAKYNGTTWSALTHNGLNSLVTALAVSGSDLYVGGFFTHTFDSGGPSLFCIAKYSGGTTWSALTHNGLNSVVFALAVMGSDLYVGGAFTKTNDGTVPNLNYIAKYSSDAWSALANNGLSGSNVQAFAVMGSDLYVGGQITQTADGMVTNLNRIAKYSGGAWSALTNNGLNSIVSALAVSGSDLYVGGNFTQTADGTVTNLNHIAKFAFAAPGYSLYLPLVIK